MFPKISRYISTDVLNNIELLFHTTLQAFNKYSKNPLQGKPMEGKFHIEEENIVLLVT